MIVTVIVTVIVIVIVIVTVTVIALSEELAWSRIPPSHHLRLNLTHSNCGCPGTRTHQTACCAIQSCRKPHALAVAVCPSFSGCCWPASVALAVSAGGAVFYSMLALVVLTPTELVLEMSILLLMMMMMMLPVVVVVVW